MIMVSVFSELLMRKFELTTPPLNPCAVRQGAATSCVSFKSTQVHGVNNKRTPLPKDLRNLITEFLNVQAINYFSFLYPSTLNNSGYLISQRIL